MSAYKYSRQYQGPLKAAIFDWSGTLADKYVIAPVIAFVEVFAKYKVPITMEEARKPMGLRKDLHIKAIAEIPSVSNRWKEVHGQAPTDADVENMFKDYVPIQHTVLRKYTALTPGCAEAIKILQKDYKMKIGSTTGFLKSMNDILLEDAKKQGYEPDAAVAGDDVLHGTRPRPFMVYKNLDIMDVHPIQAVVKVDDTVSGIYEAQEAGCWGVGVARYSNYMNINSLEEEATISEEEMQKRLEHSRDLLNKSGAHYVVDTIADIPAVCADINRRLARGEKP